MENFRSRLTILFLFLFWCSLAFSKQVWIRPAPTWRDPHSLFIPAWHPDLIESREVANVIMDDPAGRLERDFQVPRVLRGKVSFWMQIYAKYSSYTKVVHDRENPEITYGVIDFSPLYRMRLHPWKREALSRSIETKVLASLQYTLRFCFERVPGPVAKPPYIVQWERFLKQRGVTTHAQATVLASRLRSQRGQRDIFLLALSRSEHLLPELEQIFQASGLPRGLARIPFVESSFHPKAESKVSAMGIWQLMPRTARELGGSQSRKMWRDPIFQTQAAALLLKRNRSVLPDWGLTVTSYNSGVGRVSKSVRRYQVDSTQTFFESKHAPQTLGFAGKNFFSEVLAANLIEAYEDVYFPERKGEISWFESLTPMAVDAMPTQVSKPKGAAASRVLLATPLMFHIP